MLNSKNQSKHQNEIDLLITHIAHELMNEFGKSHEESMELING